MEWIYKPFSYTAIIVAIGFLVKYLIQRKIDSYFNKKLEDYKKELAVLTEKAKYDISKKLFDFEAYATKKHTIYPELYQRMFEISRQFDALIIKMGPERPDHLIKVEYSLMLIKNIKEVEGAINNGREYYNYNQLFLSKKVESAFGDTWDLIMNLRKELYDREYNMSFTQTEVLKIDEKIEILKEVIYEELSYSHFEETAVKV
jgi:hypothetical protein